MQLLLCWDLFLHHSKLPIWHHGSVQHSKSYLSKKKRRMLILHGCAVVCSRFAASLPFTDDYVTLLVVKVQCCLRLQFSVSIQSLAKRLLGYQADCVCRYTATGNLLCAIAPSMEALIAARALAGMGGGGLSTGEFSGITIVPQSDMKLTIGTVGSTIMSDIVPM